MKYFLQTHTQSYHQLENWGERQREHAQILQNLVFHCAWCQTSQIPKRIGKEIGLYTAKNFLTIVNICAQAFASDLVPIDSETHYMVKGKGALTADRQ